MNILGEIVKNKKNELITQKLNCTIEELEQSEYFKIKCKSLKNSIISSKSGIICEFKRRSPSKDIINNHSKLEDIVIGYEKAGASGISILTNDKYFDGSTNDIKKASKIISAPILRKEFIVDEYQIIESKSIGADAILLIASVLSQKEIHDFSSVAKKIGLEVLLEVHSKEELETSINDNIDIIGVNNRDLNNFNVDIKNSLNIIDQIPSGFVKISESGINSPDSIVELKKAGFDGFLIGEYFMKSDSPTELANEFINLVENEV
jgi:indole-3-glycerol phosphate synthase